MGESSIPPQKQSGAVHGTDIAETMRSHSGSVDVGQVREDKRRFVCLMKGCTSASWFPTTVQLPGGTP